MMPANLRGGGDNNLLHDVGDETYQSLVICHGVLFYWIL